MLDILALDSRTLYLLLIVAIVLERLVELRITQRNLAWAMQNGGIEAGRGHYPVMVALHTAFLIAGPAEVLLLDRPFIAGLGFPMLAVVLLGMGLRYWAVTTLGKRWTTRVVCVPGLPVVTGGPYRFVRHPNYVAVVLEIFALPLVHSAWLTALVFTVANLFLLRTRIRVEEEALEEFNDYREGFRAARASST